MIQKNLQVYLGNFNQFFQKKNIWTPMALWSQEINF